MILILILFYHCFLPSAVRSLTSKVVSGRRVKGKKKSGASIQKYQSLTKRNSQERQKKKKKAQEKRQLQGKSRKKKEKKQSSQFSFSVQKHNPWVITSVVDLVVNLLKIPWGPVIYLLYFCKSEPSGRPGPVASREGMKCCPAFHMGLCPENCFTLHMPFLSHSALAPLQKGCLPSFL